ncbi:tumor necrosis factor receptor superfamily member 5 isoform X1 [Acanthochromis polyacanthus]|uniref:tumor necrosis factor receptor superfamily member 5 isoform X1 n=1 Tax=Acanthochromis polyacanthus TaxID=80966 RepID=UPI0022345015|nr:tumor necrosis factor receptor superfamily member 5 isoform X1 [Acanthochromis polyacanthus]
MILYRLLLIGAFTVLTTAQSPCDPMTQYERDGQCCNMCGKGTSMTPSTSCEFPQCTECFDREYQEGYTKESLCNRQPYCDTHLNFEKPVHSKTAKTICKCIEGFHCAAKDCKTCVAHTQCGPGQGAQTKGSHTHDTQCEECPEGTFSNETSWSSPCKEWTSCEGTFYTEQKGTSTSDTKCVASSRLHIVVICVVLLVAAVIAALATAFICKAHMKEKAKPCIELCRGDEHRPLQHIEVRTPVEDIEAEPEQSLLEISSEGPVTVMGNPVREEYGKSEIFPRQESQTETCPSL